MTGGGTAGPGVPAVAGGPSSGVPAPLREAAARAARAAVTATVPALLPASVGPADRELRAALDAALRPVIGAPEGKPRSEWTEEERERAFAVAQVDPASLTAAQRAEARALVGRLDGLLGAPVDAARLAAWLRPINGTVRNPQALPDFAARCVMLAEVLGDLPAAVFVAETRGRLRCEFFPAAEEIRRAVEPVVEDWRRRRAILERFAEGRPRPGGGAGGWTATRSDGRGFAGSLGEALFGGGAQGAARDRDPPDPARVAAQVEALREAARRAEGARRRPVPRPLPPRQLVACLRAEAARGGLTPEQRAALLARADAIERPRGEAVRGAAAAAGARRSEPDVGEVVI